MRLPLDLLGVGVCVGGRGEGRFFPVMFSRAGDGLSTLFGASWP